MEKDQILEDLFKSFRVAINNATLYFDQHPIFLHAVCDLKEKIDKIFLIFDPLVIGITPKSLLVNDTVLENSKVYHELAGTLHRRKIKRITIEKDVSVHEIALLLSKLGLSAKDAIKSGGFNAIEIPHIIVENLDYMQFLKEGGKQQKDIWSVLLAKAVKDNNKSEISEFVDNFDVIANKFQAVDFIENDEIRSNLHTFLEHLHTNDHDQFKKCTKEVIKLILSDKNIPKDINLDNIKSFFDKFETGELSNTLWEQVVTDEKFDFLTFNLFSQLVNQEKHNEIALSLASKITKGDLLKNNPQAVSRIRKLFSSDIDSDVSKVYRKTLSSILQDTLIEGERSIDRKQVNCNYRYILLNLFILERRLTWLKLISERILSEWNRAMEENDAEYLQLFIEALDKKKRLDPSLESAFVDTEREIFGLVEEKVLKGEVTSCFEVFYNTSSKSFIGITPYTAAIFKDRKINRSIMQLYFKFFGYQVDHFKREMNRNRHDLEFIREIIDSVKTIDSPFSLEVLKFIFNFSNILLKVDAIKAMRELAAYSLYDGDLLLSLIKKRNIFLKREALAVIATDEALTSQAVKELFNQSNFFGFRNNIFLENIRMAEDVKFFGARECLISLSRDKSFWRKEVAKGAKQLLEDWDRGKKNERN
ncbi:MAG: hypothetical protein GY858_07285 [Candidatus Omnitrophica bacterium]|nr:hypothetical protein [Candidatus Omnitrophota bacterium]